MAAKRSTGRPLFQTIIMQNYDGFQFRRPGNRPAEPWNPAPPRQGLFLEQWAKHAQDVTTLEYSLNGQNEIDCRVVFALEIILHFEDGDKHFKPGQGLLTNDVNGITLTGILDGLRHPYVVYNDHIIN